MTEKIVWISGVPVGTSLIKVKSSLLEIINRPIKVEFLNKCNQNSFSSPVLNTISVKLNQKGMFNCTTRTNVLSIVVFLNVIFSEVVE